jgi:hypothetical protein
MAMPGISRHHPSYPRTTNAGSMLVLAVMALVVGLFYTV